MPFDNLHFNASIISFVGTLFFLYICYEFGIKIGLVDRPSWRKTHKGKVPLIGGIAIIFGFSLGCLISPRGLNEWRPLFLCIIPLAVIGVMDDHGDISVSKRIIVQIVSCCIMIFYGNINLVSFGDLFGLGYPLELNKLVAVPITIICVVGVINALNLIDGIDGLCGMISLIASLSICLIVKLKDVDASIALILYFSAAMMAFLLINLEVFRFIVKKVFLGDAGTTIIGFFLCWHLIRLSSGDNAVFRPITAVWLLALPIMDTLAVMIRRIRSQKSPFRPGRDHIHHQLMNIGLSSRNTLMILVACSMLLVGVGVMCEVKEVPEPFMFYGILILFGLYYAGSEKLSRHSKPNCVNL